MKVYIFLIKDSFLFSKLSLFYFKYYYIISFPLPFPHSNLSHEYLVVNYKSSGTQGRCLVSLCCGEEEWGLAIPPIC